MRQALDELLAAALLRDGRGISRSAGAHPVVGRGSDGASAKLVLQATRVFAIPAQPGELAGEQQKCCARAEPEAWRELFLQPSPRGAMNGSASEASDREVPAVELCLDALESCLPARRCRGHWKFCTTCSMPTMTRMAARHERERCGRPAQKVFRGSGISWRAAARAQGNDPLAQDLGWSRHQVAALLSLTREFTAAFTEPSANSVAWISPTWNNGVASPAE